MGRNYFGDLTVHILWSITLRKIGKMSDFKAKMPKFSFR